MLSPSFQIAFQICLAFIVGRVIGRWTSRVRIARMTARIVVTLIAIAFCLYVWRSGITWHVALIGIALAAGCFSYGLQKHAPRVFP